MRGVLRETTCCFRSRWRVACCVFPSLMARMNIMIGGALYIERKKNLERLGKRMRKNVEDPYLHCRVEEMLRWCAEAQSQRIYYILIERALRRSRIEPRL